MINPRFNGRPSFAAAALASALLAACSAHNQIGVQSDGGAGSGAGKGGAAGSGTSIAGTNGAAGATGAAGTGGPTGAAGTIGAAGATAATGTGGSAGTSGPAGTTGTAGRGGTAGATAGTGGIAPRVLIVDPASSRFVTYDRTGQVVRDYAQKLDFGTGFTARNVWVDAWLLPWDGPLDARLGDVMGGSYVPGEPPAPSRILIRAASTPAGTTTVRIVATNGQTLGERNLAGDWAGFQLSPKGAYVYANATGSQSGSDKGAVVRLADGAVLWQKTVMQAGFARDDRHFVYIPASVSTPLRLLDLATGADNAPPVTQPPFNFQAGAWATLITSTEDRVVIRNMDALPIGRLLWSMDWQLKIVRFGADMPQYTEEFLRAINPAGTKALWSRQTNGSDGNPVVYVGDYETDFTTAAAAPFSAAPFECYGRPAGSVAFKLVSGALQRCACGDGACTTIATVPAKQDEWTARVVASSNGSAAVVVYDWPLNRLPTTFPDSKCFSATGTVLATLPNGQATIDDTGQLVLIVQSALSGSNRLGITDLVSGTITWIGTPVSARIVYE